MADFTKMTLIQGIEYAVISQDYIEGTSIVETLEKLIASGIVEREGKVETIISERKSSFEEAEIDKKTENRPVLQNTSTTINNLEKIQIKRGEKIELIANLLEERQKQFPSQTKEEIAELLKILSANNHEIIKLKSNNLQFTKEIENLAAGLQKILETKRPEAINCIKRLEKIILSGDLVKEFSDSEKLADKLNAEEKSILARIRLLPEKYHTILLQLLKNWEAGQKR